MAPAQSHLADAPTQRRGQICFLVLLSVLLCSVHLVYDRQDLTWCQWACGARDSLKPPPHQGALVTGSFKPSGILPSPSAPRAGCAGATGGIGNKQGSEPLWSRSGKDGWKGNGSRLEKQGQREGPGSSWSPLAREGCRPSLVALQHGTRQLGATGRSWTSWQQMWLMLSSLQSRFSVFYSFLPSGLDTMRQWQQAQMLVWVQD